MKPLRLAPYGLLLLLGACGNATPPPKDAAPPEAPPTATTASPAASAIPPVLDAGAGPEPTADRLDAGAGPDADRAAVAPFAPDNKVAPTEGPELQARARGLFEAIVKDEPERGEAFWFPREPFLPLKDVKDPGKYWDQLHRSYVNDVHALHETRKSWNNAAFVGFDGWSHPKWVKPGDEANHIGYHRAFRGKLRYKVDGEDGELEVRTLITWQGRWFITHLRKVKR